MINKMKAVKEDIKYILTQYPAYRNDDNKLICAYYYRVYGGKQELSNMSALEFLKKLSTGEYAAPDTITRVRRRVQEQFPELRGDKYKERHQIEDDVRNNIHNL